MFVNYGTCYNVKACQKKHNATKLIKKAKHTIQRLVNSIKKEAEASPF
jgi:hypothetical protein